MRNRIIRAGIAALFVWGALSGCSDDSATGPDNQKTPPVLPSVSTMKPALDFYGGFYLQPDDDRICAKRETIRSRVGGSCRIERFRLLEPQVKQVKH